MKTDFKEIDVIYICIGFSAHKMNGDKNFYLDLFQNLTQKGLKILVISLSDPLNGKCTIDGKSFPYSIVNLSRPFHIFGKKKFWTLQGKSFVYKHQHNVFLEHIERYIALLYWNKLIKNIIKKSHPRYVHYIDPFIGTFDYPDTIKIMTQAKVDNKYPFFYTFYLYLVFKNIKNVIFFNKEQVDLVQICDACLLDVKQSVTNYGRFSFIYFNCTY